MNIKKGILPGRRRSIPFHVEVPPLLWLGRSCLSLLYISSLLKHIELRYNGSISHYYFFVKSIFDDYFKK